jgi:hypothetical protein
LIVRTLLAALLLVSAVAVGSCGAAADSKQAPQAAAQLRPCGRPGSRPARYDHVVWIVMENKSYSQATGPSSAPFMSRLGASCGVATNFYAESHPSLPNYLAMTSGSTHGVHDDAPPSAHPISGPSIFSELNGNWRALQESMSRPCQKSNFSKYAVKHNPVIYYTNLGRSCLRRDVSLTTPPDLSARFTFITPNLCNDTHDCSISVGDRFLSGLVTEIVQGPQYRAGRTALFITYDEDNHHAGNHILTVVVAPHVRAGTRSATRFTHYSLLGTTEQMLGLKKLGAASSASSMRAAFGL